MKWILIVVLMVIVPDTTIKKKPTKAPAVLKDRNIKLDKLNQKQAIQMIRLDSIIKVRDSVKKIKKSP